MLFILTSSIGLGLSQFLMNQESSWAQNKNKDSDKEKVFVKCYQQIINEDVGPEPVTVDELNTRLNILEKQYKEKKIDEKAYKQTKNNIINQIKVLKEQGRN